MIYVRFLFFPSLSTLLMATPVVLALLLVRSYFCRITFNAFISFNLLFVLNHIRYLISIPIKPNFVFVLLHSLILSVLIDTILKLFIMEISMNNEVSICIILCGRCILKCIHGEGGIINSQVPITCYW